MKELYTTADELVVLAKRIVDDLNQVKNEREQAITIIRSFVSAGYVSKDKLIYDAADNFLAKVRRND